MIALGLVSAYKFTTDDENELLVTRVIANINVFQTVQYSPKVLITALTEMLMLYEVPFVQRRYVVLLDLTVSLLEFMNKSKSSTYFGKEECDDEAEYGNALILLKNDMKAMDEYSFFKSKIIQLKNKNQQLLVDSKNKLPETKQKFFMEILTIEKVAGVPRVIHKINPRK